MVAREGHAQYHPPGESTDAHRKDNVPGKGSARASMGKPSIQRTALILTRVGCEKSETRLDGHDIKDARSLRWCLYQARQSG